MIYSGPTNLDLKNSKQTTGRMPSTDKISSNQDTTQKHSEERTQDQDPHMDDHIPDQSLVMN